MEGRIEHSDFNKLADIIYRLSSTVTIKANVELVRIGIDGMKKSYHREVQTSAGIKMTREFIYYYTLERAGDDYISIMIRASDMILFQRRLNDVLKWFEDGNTFVVKNKKLVLLPTKPLIVPGLAANKYIQFDPIVYQFDETSAVSPGVRITLGDPNEYVDIDVDKVYGMKYALEANMFLVSQNIVNYLGRPDFGTNLYIMDAYNRSIPKEDEIVNSKKRRLVSNTEKKNRSFFDVND